MHKIYEIVKPSIYGLKLVGIDGKEIDLSQFQGRKIIIVNVASKCGYTSQYKQLQELYENFQDKLAIIGIPSNDFGGQEPGTHQEIMAFCSTKYEVSFLLSEKMTIKSPYTHPLYEWLTKKSLNGVMNSTVKWNFHKYLIDENGQFVTTYPSSVSPIDEAILDWVQQ